MKFLVASLFFFVLFLAGFLPVDISFEGIEAKYALADHCGDEVACPSDAAEIHSCYAPVPGWVCSGTDYGPACVANQGQACNVNACGTAGGTVNCDGTCSGPTPATPYTVGAACTSTANNCGATNSGTITDACTGACSASAPADVTGLGGACTSAANACGATNTGTYVCNAAGTGSTCSATTPATPYTIGAACNRNVCGGTGTITDACTGACSELAPSCDTTPPTGTFSASATVVNPGSSVVFTIEAQDAGSGLNWLMVGLPAKSETNFQFCGGASPCTKTFIVTVPNTEGVYDYYGYMRDNASNTGFPVPSTITITVSNVTLNAELIPNPLSGNAPLTVTMTVDIGGSATGDALLHLYCNNGAGTESPDISVDASSYTFGTKCVYSSAGNYLPRVMVKRQGLSGETSIGISVSSPPADTTAPNNVTGLTSGSHTISTWKNDSTVDVSWAAATDNAGGSGLDGYSILWDTTSNTLPDNTKDIEEGIVTGTSPSLANGNSHYFHIRSVDNAGNWAAGAAHLGPFFIDTAVPATSFTDPATTPVGVTPAAGSWQDSSFTTSVSDADNAAGSGLSACHYGVYSDPAGWTVPLGTARTCNSNLSITVGPAGDCRNTGTNKCQVQVYSRDVAGNSSPIAMRAYSITFLTYPAGTWQRLWYSTSGASPSFTSTNFLGETPNETSATFSTDWGAGVLAYTRVDSIGFKSSRTINFPTAGTYRFTIGSDDGARLFIDGVNQVDQWADGSYRTAFKDIVITAGDHQFELDFYENGGNAMGSFDYIPTPCQKVAVPPTSNLLQDPSSLTLPLPTGDRVCSLTIAHLGSDNTDGLTVAFESLSNPANANYIGMDDNTASGCENNLKFHNVWDTVAGAHNFNVSSAIDTPFSAGNALGYGFTLSTDCAIKNFAGLCSGPGNYCPIGAKAADDRSFTVTGQKSNKADTDVNLAGLQNNQTTDGFAFQFNIVECTQNSHCTADPTKAKCNVDADNNGVGDITSNFNPNTCIDSVAPTSKMKKPSGNTIEDDSNVVPIFISKPGGAYSAYLKATPNTGDPNKRWWIYVQDTDIGGADVDKCYISFNGGSASERICDTWVSLWVGSQPGANCSDQNDNTCTIKVWSRDRATNTGSTSKLSDFTSDERNFSLYTFNEFSFGVDYTAPTAQ